MERSYKPYWPVPDPGLSPFSGSPTGILDKALASLYDWEKQAQANIQRLEVARSRVADLLMLEELLISRETVDLDYSLLTTAGPLLSTRLFLVPEQDGSLERIPQTVLWKEYATSRHKYLLLVGADEDLNALAAELALKK